MQNDSIFDTGPYRFFDTIRFNTSQPWWCVPVSSFKPFFYSSLRSLLDPERAVILAGPTIIVGVVTSTGKLFLITIPSISSTNPCSRRRGSWKCKTHAFVHVQNESGMRGVELFFQQAPPVSVYNASSW